MNAYYFITLFIILVVTVTSFTIRTKENFQTEEPLAPTRVVESPPLRVVESPVQQRNVDDTLQAYTYPSDTLLFPSPGQIASFNSLPYQDPSSERANFQRILSVQTTLQGFLDQEASRISDLSDPAIVLPLTTARGDLTRLRNEVMVLRRNPGINSTLTQGDVDEIEANLAYLQRMWRLNVYNDVNGVEGFRVEGFDVTTNRASLNDLQTLITRINSTTLILSSSGTNDPVVRARITALNEVKNNVNNIITDVQSGGRSESEIPITRDAYLNFLRTVDNTNSPLTNLMDRSGLPTTLSDLFPTYSSGDVSGANLSKYLFQKYADILLKGLSWDVNISYTGDNEVEVSKSLANQLSSILSKSYLDQSIIGRPVYTGPVYTGPIDNRGEFAKKITDLQNGGTKSPTTTTTNPPPTTTTDTTTPTAPKSTAPVKFDWHERANFICESIKKREMNPEDFGCLKSEEYVSENFSWRGYAKMICNRLATSYDSGLPELCGCPDASWKGWRP